MKLFPFQTEDLGNIDRFDGRVLLAWDMGLGKTVEVLARLSRNPRTCPAVVVCPASVKYHWEREAKGFGFEVKVLEGQKPEGDLVAPLTVINYDILRYWLDRLIRDLDLQTIVVDECQYIANHKALRTKAVKALCRGVPNVLALSGTPLLNRPIEMFPTLNILWPDVFRSRWKYAERYCNLHRTHWGWDLKGSSNLDELHEKLLASCMIRRRKADVLPDLPETIRQVTPLPLSDRAEYDRADADFLGWLRERSPGKVASAAKAEALVKMNYLLQLAARLKLPAVVGWINDWLEQSDEKLILFAVHRKMVEALERRCKAGSVVIDGSVTGRRRQEAVDRFQSDKGVRLCIGNIQAAGTGIDGLQRAASTMAFCEIGWTPGGQLQAEGRIAGRIGGRGTTWCHYLVARDTLEEGLCELVQAKQVVISATLDGGIMDGDLDVFDKLISELRKGE